MDLSQHLRLYPLPWQDDHVRTQQMGALAINVWPGLDTVLIENHPHETPNSGPARVQKDHSALGPSVSGL